jgi:hypothetical protein
MHNGPKILTIDIETAPLEAWAWGLFDQNIALNQIKTEWSVLAYAAKWLDKKAVIYADTGGRGPRKVRDDKGLLSRNAQVQHARCVGYGESLFKATAVDIGAPESSRVRRQARAFLPEVRQHVAGVWRLPRNAGRALSPL